MRSSSAAGDRRKDESGKMKDEIIEEDEDFAFKGRRKKKG